MDDSFEVDFEEESGIDETGLSLEIRNALDKLTDKQKLFVASYLGPSRMVPWKAAQDAGYNGDIYSLRVLGTRVKAIPVVRHAIDIILKHQVGSESEALRRLTDSSTYSVDDVLNERGEVDLKKARGNGSIAYIKTITYDKDGALVKVEMYDSQDANKTILAYYAKQAALKVAVVPDETPEGELSEGVQSAIEKVYGSKSEPTLVV